MRQDLPDLSLLLTVWNSGGFVDALCHASTVTDNLENTTDRINTAVAALKRFKAKLKQRSDSRDGLTSKRLMDLPEDLWAILLSSIAFIFRDEVDEGSQIDFGNEMHVEMLQASVTSSLAKLTNPQGRPVNEALDVFFPGLRDLYQKTTGKEATSIQEPRLKLRGSRLPVAKPGLLGLFAWYGKNWFEGCGVCW